MSTLSPLERYWIKSAWRNIDLATPAKRYTPFSLSDFFFGLFLGLFIALLIEL